MKTKDEWLDDMEQRLKRALLDVTDLNEVEGINYLQQEIVSHLDDVSSERERFDYLLNLQERFPRLLPDDFESDGKPQLDDFPKSEMTTEEAMDLVRRNWTTLDEESRNEFLTDLRGVDATVAPAMSSAAQDDTFLGQPSDEFVRFLKLPEEMALSGERMQTALIGLLKTVSQVDSLGTQVYKQVGMARDLSSEDIRKLVGNYLSGGGVEVDQLNQVFDETRLKVGLIISSIASIPESLSNSYMAKFQPTLIEQSIGGGGLLSGKEAKCWKKYVALSEDIKPQKLEKAINDLIIKQLKKLKRR